MKPFKSHIPYTKHSISEKDIQAVTKVLKSDFLTTGPENELFERKFSEYIGTKFAVTCSSGTSALHLLALCVEDASNGNFITTPLTFVADANCARYVGADVKFADTEISTFNVSIESIMEKIDSNTKCIVVTHYAGLPADIHKLEEYCKINNIFLIEDACHSPGAYLNSKHTGTFGDAAIFSLHPAKHVAAGEGGIITTNNESLYEKLKRLRNHGLESWQKRKGYVYDIKELGFNFRMTDSEAALASSQLDNLDKSVEKRNKIANQYLENIDLDFYNVQKITEDRSHAYHLFPVVIPQNKNRDEFMNYLRELNIGATIHYPLINKLSFYKDCNQDTPNSEYIGNKIISIPMYPTLDESEIEFVISALNNFSK